MMTHPLARPDRAALRQLRPAFRSRRLMTLFLKIAMLSLTRPHTISDVERTVADVISGDRLARQDVGLDHLARPRAARAQLGEHRGPQPLRQEAM